MNEKICICIPSRGARSSLWKLIESWEKTTSGNSVLLVGIDKDEEDKYRELFRHPNMKIWIKVFTDILPHCPKLEKLSTLALNTSPIICSIGDDFIFHTPGWEEKVIEWQEREKGICYGNDLLQGETLPTCAFINSIIPKTLGYICPPGLKSYRCDNFWKDFGLRIGRIEYFPDIIIEHNHWSANKAENDETYKLGQLNEHTDAKVYDKYVTSGQMAKDVEKVKKVL